MARPPRPRGEALLDASLVWHVIFVSPLFLAGVFGMFSYGVDRGYAIDEARTLAVNTLVVLEIFHLFFVRNIHGTSLTWKLVRGTPMGAGLDPSARPRTSRSALPPPVPVS